MKCTIKVLKSLSNQEVNRITTPSNIPYFDLITAHGVSCTECKHFKADTVGKCRLVYDVSPHYLVDGTSPPVKFIHAHTNRTLGKCGDEGKQFEAYKKGDNPDANTEESNIITTLQARIGGVPFCVNCKYYIPHYSEPVLGKCRLTNDEDTGDPCMQTPSDMRYGYSASNRTNGECGVKGTLYLTANKK